MKILKQPNNLRSPIDASKGFVEPLCGRRKSYSIYVYNTQFACNMIHSYGHIQICLFNYSFTRSTPYTNSTRTQVYNQNTSRTTRPGQVAQLWQTLIENVSSFARSLWYSWATCNAILILQFRWHTTCYRDYVQFLHWQNSVEINITESTKH